MADDVTLPATGAAIGTDEVDLGGGLVHVQYVKLVDGTEEGTERLPGSAARGLVVDPRPKIVTATAAPVMSTTQYTAKDAIGGLLTFSNAVRATGGAGRITRAAISDKAAQRADVTLVLFDRAITAPVDNAVFDPTDAELAFFLGAVGFGQAFYEDFSDNAAAVTVPNLPFVLNGTDLFGVLVSRGAPTYASTSDLSITLQIEQD